MIPAMQDEMMKMVAADLGIAGLPEDQQKMLIEQFGEVALKAATVSVAEKIPEGKRDEFVSLAQAGDARALQEFLDRELPGHEEIAKNAVAEEVAKFKAFQAQ